jgi:16S rRNA G966 N2-methylase RsmD
VILVSFIYYFGKLALNFRKKMHNCTHCTSADTKFIKNRLNKNGTTTQRYMCQTCNRWFSKQLEDVVAEPVRDGAVSKYVITSCQNNTPVHEEFLYALRNYCDYHNAELLIVPINYRASDYDVLEYEIPEDVEHTLVTTKLKIHDEVFVMGKFNFIPTTVNPLAGLESLSRGDTLIVPSPQLRMKASAVSASRHPAILHTTGAISHPQYANNKVGEKAQFNHSYSAVLVEIDSDNDFHVRVLSCDGDNKFRDIGNIWSADSKHGPDGFDYAAALVTGDEHAIFASPTVKAATYTNKDSIVNVLNPDFVVRHDVLDMYSGSHHHRGDSIKTVAKHVFGMDKVEDELKKTVEYIKETTLGNYKNIIVPSNHSDHLTKWLTTVDIKHEPWNALFYHKMMYNVLNTLKQGESGVSYADPFKLYCESVDTPRTQFLAHGESFSISGVELGSHGHEGKNGARGSINQYADLSQRYVIGHSHTPGIIYGAYQVGTSSNLKLEYTSGPSSWINTHCIVYSNGKRQLINIINGKWRA